MTELEKLKAAADDATADIAYRKLRIYTEALEAEIIKLKGKDDELEKLRKERDLTIVVAAAASAAYAIGAIDVAAYTVAHDKCRAAMKAHVEAKQIQEKDDA